MAMAGRGALSGDVPASSLDGGKGPVGERQEELQSYQLVGQIGIGDGQKGVAGEEVWAAA